MSGAIWLASYPKSGNTWARLALLSLQNGGGAVELRDIGSFGELVSTHELMEAWLDIETGDLTLSETEALRPDFHAAYFGVPGPPQLCKVHDRWIRTAAGRPLYDPAFTRAAVYFLRDPRDVAVSWSNFTGMPLDRAIAFLSDPEAALGSSERRLSNQVHQPLGHWSEHVASWIDESGLAPIAIRYEDMLADPGRVLARVAEHIGWAAPGDAVAGAVEVTRFERLADQERRHGFFQRADRTERFFLSGRAGGWRESLTADQAARIEREHGPMMARFGYL